jgi:hypothetical protein
MVESNSLTSIFSKKHALFGGNGLNPLILGRDSFSSGDDKREWLYLKGHYVNAASNEADGGKEQDAT